MPSLMPDILILKYKRWIDGKEQLSKNTFVKNLHVFLDGMSNSMKKLFEFVNVAGNTFNKITDRLMDQEYNVNVSAPAA
jgi:hypothetical protein